MKWSYKAKANDHSHTRACFSEQMTANCGSHITSAALLAVGDSPLFTLPAECCPVSTMLMTDDDDDDDDDD